jgi:hypothetical protein
MNQKTDNDNLAEDKDQPPRIKANIKKSLTLYIKKKVEQHRRRLEREDKLK